MEQQQKWWLTTAKVLFFLSTRFNDGVNAIFHLCSALRRLCKIIATSSNVSKLKINYIRHECKASNPIDAWAETAGIFTSFLFIFFSLSSYLLWCCCTIGVFSHIISWRALLAQNTYPALNMLRWTLLNSFSVGRVKKCSNTENAPQKGLISMW